MSTPPVSTDVTAIAPPYIPPYEPVPNITPFTYRDGMTYLQRMERLVKYINRVVIPWVQENYDSLADAYIKGFEEIIAYFDTVIGDLEGKSVEEALDEMTAYIDAAVDSIINSTIAVSDPVILAIISNLTTESSKYLSKRFGTAAYPEMWGAKGDGVTDDSAAFTAMLATSPYHIVLGENKSYVINPTLLIIPDGGLIEGSSSANYGIGVNAAKPSELRIKPIAGYDATMDVKLDPTSPSDVPDNWAIKLGNGTVARNFKIKPLVDPCDYRQANYPGAGNNTTIGSIVPTNNAGIGVFAASSVTLENLWVESFYENFSLGVVNHVSKCFSRMGHIGYLTRSSDGEFDNSVAMFNAYAGVYVKGAYWRFSNCRFEWNARYGIYCSAETSLSNNLFDRNGWAGVKFPDGLWGQVLVGNYFSRNGVGGDGVNGRWSFTVPGHLSYVVTAPEQSCHIEFGYQRNLVIIGNRFRIGKDDSNGGMSGPRHIYGTTNSNGSTVAGDQEIYGNAGVWSTTTKGYTPSNNYADVQGIAAGTDTALNTFLNTRPFGMGVGIYTNGAITGTDILDVSKEMKGSGIVPTTSMKSASQALTVDVTVLKGKACTIYMQCSSSGGEGYGIIHIVYRTGGSVPYSIIENKLGTKISSIAITNIDATYDKVTVTFTGTSWSSWNIVYAQ